MALIQGFYCITLFIYPFRRDLDADHYGLDKVKKRVLEYLAVRQLKNSLKGPILCFVGPPGVGKTSLGKSLANTVGREFHRCDVIYVWGVQIIEVGDMVNF